MKISELLVETSILPPKVLGTQLGKFFAEFAGEIKKAVLVRDTHAFTTCTAYFDTEDPRLNFFLTFQAVPRPRPPAISKVGALLLKKHKLNRTVALQFEKELEDTSYGATSWCFFITTGVAELLEADDDLDVLNDAMAEAFKANIGDVDYTVHT